MSVLAKNTETITDGIKMGKGFIGARQTTIRREIVLTGIGVHSGAVVTVGEF